MAARRWPIRCAGQRPDLQIGPPKNCKYDGPRGCHAPAVCAEPGRSPVNATPSSLRRELRVVNPATLEEVGLVPATEPEGVGEIVAEARHAQERWARQSFAARTRLLRDAARVVLEDMDEIAATIVAETGKPVPEAI